MPTTDQVSRNPQVRFGDNLDDDLVRRDFTVNAMAVRITGDGPGRFCDPLGGLAAIRQRILTPQPPRRCPSVMIRCACCALRGSFRSWNSGVAERVREAIVAMAPSCPGSPSSG